MTLAPDSARHEVGGVRATPIAIIIPMMDRSGDLEASLPSLLNQDYPDYRVYIIDMGSRDDLDGVLLRHASSFLERIRRERPERFSFSKTRNIGALASAGDLLLFLNGDNCFTSTTALSDIVRDVTEAEADPTWFANWRQYVGYAPLAAAPGRTVMSRWRQRYAHCHGSPLLVERAVFEQLGGYNELLEDWGYEDTDLIARLELAGFGRVEMRGVGVVPVPNEEEARVKNFTSRNRELTWARNRLISDFMIRTWGVAFAATSRPGSRGVVHSADRPAPGEWVVEHPLTASDIDCVIRTRTRYSSMAADDLTLRDARFPRVTVLVPSRDAAVDLRRTLSSIRLQEYPQIEVIVIDAAAPGEPLPPLGRPLERLLQTGRPSLAIPPSDWRLGSGDVLAWVNAGDAWEPGIARVAVSAFLRHVDAQVLHHPCTSSESAGDFVLDHALRASDLPGAAGHEDVPGGRCVWAHRLRIVETLHRFEHGASNEVARQIGAWFSRQADQADTPQPPAQWQINRSHVTVTYQPETGRLQLSGVSADRDLHYLETLVDTNGPASTAPKWRQIAILEASGRSFRGAIDIPHDLFRDGQCRIAINLHFRDGSILYWFEQPARVIHAPSADVSGR